MAAAAQMDYKDLVSYFGSQTETARRLGVKQPSVNAWLSGKAKMSSVTAVVAEEVTNGKFRAVDLCPQLKQSLQKAKTP